MASPSSVPAVGMCRNSGVGSNSGVLPCPIPMQARSIFSCWVVLPVLSSPSSTMTAPGLMAKGSFMRPAVSSTVNTSPQAKDVGRRKHPCRYPTTHVVLHGRWLGVSGGYLRDDFFDLDLDA